MIRTVAIKDLDICTVYDPARSRESQYGRLARHASLTAGMDYDYNVDVLEAWSLRCSLDKVLIELERQCDLWTPRKLDVESTAAQSAIADICYTWINMNHNIAPLNTDLIPDTRVNKKWRIRMELQRVAPYGRLYIQQQHYALRSEMLAMPNGQTIDLVDVLAYAIQLLNPPLNDYKPSIEDYVNRRLHDNGSDKRNIFDQFNVPKPRQPPANVSFVYSRAG